MWNSKEQLLDPGHYLKDWHIHYNYQKTSKLSNSQHNLPWMNRNFKILIRKKGRRFKKAKKSGMDEDRARYLDIEQMVKRELWYAERVHVNGIQNLYRMA